MQDDPIMQETKQEVSPIETPEIAEGQETEKLSRRELRKKKKNEKPKRPLWQEILSWVWPLLGALVIALVVRTLLFEPVKVDGSSMLDTLNDGEIMFVGKTSYSSFWVTWPWASDEDKEASTKLTFFGNPERFDPVVCRYPHRGTTNFVKRVVGLPGDTVAIIGGYLYVNGEKYDEPYINNEYRMNYYKNQEPIIIQLDEGSHLQLPALYGYSIICNALLLKHQDGTSEFIWRENQDEDSETCELVYEDGVLAVNGEPVAYNAETDTIITGQLLSFKEVTVPDGYYFVMGDHRNNSNDSRNVGAIERSYIMGRVRQVIWPLGNWRGVQNGLEYTAE